MYVCLSLKIVPPINFDLILVPFTFQKSKSQTRQGLFFLTPLSLTLIKFFPESAASTLQLSGASTTIYTLGNGLATASALTCVAPKVRRIKCSLDARSSLVCTDETIPYNHRKERTSSPRLKLQQWSMVGALVHP